MEEITQKNHLEIVNFTNVDKEDFEGMWGGEITIIKAGETKPFPRFLAQHFTKHLIDKILHRGNSDASDGNLRNSLEAKILGNTPEKEEDMIEVAKMEVFEEKPKEEISEEIPKGILENKEIEEIIEKPQKRVVKKKKIE